MLEGKILDRQTQYDFHKKSKPHIKGFTLMEVLIVLFVVSIMISGVMTVFIQVIRANDSTSYYARAYKDIDSQMETYRRTVTFDSVATGTFPVTNLTSGATGTVTVSNIIDGQPQTDIKSVDLVIRWTYNGKTNQVEESSYLYRNGIGR